ncbi:MAG TPA: ATP-dependent RNA helicase HrpA [Cellvibrionaceae bacterium]
MNQTDIFDPNTCLIADVPKLQQILRTIAQRKKAGQAADRSEQQFSALLAQSMQTLTTRRQYEQAIEFPAQLPISEKREDIASLISAHQVVVLAGETGSGKTTQLPKICLSLGLGQRGLIGHTQPRRLAARAVAERIATELKSPLGQRVGYQVRFTDMCAPSSQIKLMTDGILLAEIQHDPLLLRYDALIIDEAHERSLNIDFILGYLKRLLPKRPDLKIIITSATIDLQRFSEHFNNAPIIEVSGRTYPVEVWYRPVAGEIEQTEAILAATEEILTLPKHAGDILVFLSGEREIRDTAKALRALNRQDLIILPLYARLSNAEQNRIFANARGRKIILATNVAETSITVPGIGYVIDPGFARISRYSHRSKLQRLPIEAISKASANQRAGRCGRVASGICIRLYDEQDFNQRADFTDAEIMRTNLAAVILQMLAVGVGDIRKFPFVDAPDPRLISDGFKLLEELNAVSPQGQLTTVGRSLAKLPIDPKLGRILLAANQRGCLTEILIITTAMANQDPRERPADKQQASDEKHRRFWHVDSDFLTWVNLWSYVEEQRQALSANQFKKLCEKEFLSWMRLREWRELHHQVRLACKEAGFKENATPASFEAIHKALLAGLCANIGMKSEESAEQDYLGARNRKFFIFPASSQFKKRPKWILAASLLETSKVYGHMVAKIDPEWLLATAEHLLKHHYYQPHYAHQTGQVMAYDRVTLYGLIIKDKHRINYALINPAETREVFIRQALVEGGYGRNPPHKVGEFYRHNLALIEEVHGLEAKSRRKDILVDDEVIFTFYSDRLPDVIANLAGFEHWRKTTEREQPKLLFMLLDLLKQHDAQLITDAQFPKLLLVDGMELPLSYHFEPGAADDGVSVQVPVDILHTLPQPPLEWLVPGLIRDKLIALLKCLPKQWRKRFVPIPDAVDKIMLRVVTGKRPLLDVLAEELHRLAGEKLPADIWANIDIDPFYQMNIKITDDKNQLIAQGRDLAELRLKYRANVQQSLQNVGDDVERTGINRWDFGVLEHESTLMRGKVRIRAYPALIDQGALVDLKLIDNPQEAAWLTARGLSRLALLSMPDASKYLYKNLFKKTSILLTNMGVGTPQQVIDDLLLAAVYQAYFSQKSLPRTEQEFSALLEPRSLLTHTAIEYERVLETIFVQVIALKNQMKAVKNALTVFDTVASINDQLTTWLFPGFIFATPLIHLQQLTRYIGALQTRFEKALLSPQKDKQINQEIMIYWKKHQERWQQKGAAAFFNSAAWQEYRWLIEELRVSLFAQQLKTRVPVSAKRLAKAWEAVNEQV